MKANSKFTLENMFSSARHIASAAGLIAISYFGSGCDILDSQRVSAALPEKPKTECPSLRRASIEDSLIISVPGTNYSKIILTDEDFPRYGLKPAGNPESVIGYTPVTIDVRDLGTDALVSNPVVIYYNRTPTKLYTSSNGSVVIDNNPTAITEEDPCLADALAKQAEGPDPLVLPSNITMYTFPDDSLLRSLGKKFQNSFLLKPWPWSYPAKVAFTNYGTMSSENLQKFKDRLPFINNRLGLNLFEYTPDSTQANVITRVKDSVSQTRFCPYVYSDKDLVTLRWEGLMTASLWDFMHEIGWHIATRIASEGGFGNGWIGSGGGEDFNDTEVLLIRAKHLPQMHGLPPIDWSNYSSN